MQLIFFNPSRGFYAHTGKSEAERNIIKWLSLSLITLVALSEVHHSLAEGSKPLHAKHAVCAGVWRSQRLE